MAMLIEIGDRVRITNARRADYGKTGVVTDTGISGGWYVRLDGSDESVYVPFGVEREERGR